MPETVLTSPIELSSSIRDADGVPLALANTVDGGEAVVVWKNSSWVLSKGFNVGAYNIDEYWLGIENMENLKKVEKRVNKKNI